MYNMEADIVNTVLQGEEKTSTHFKSVDVIKDISLEIDEGNLLSVDNNIIDIRQYRTQKDEYLKNIARDNIQALINKIWVLPVERLEDVIVAKLPSPVTATPREKPIPKPRPPTKWEEYAKAKGIQKKKKSKAVWDDVLKKWHPRWGYKKGEVEKEKDWLIEVPENADPYEDQYAKKKEAKAENVAKNELHRLRNIARAKNVKLPNAGLAPTETPSKEQVSIAARLAKLSTASLGKFTEKLPLEKPQLKIGKKRKFEPLFGNMEEEKKKNLDILNKITNKQPSLDVNKAVAQSSLDNADNRGPKKLKKASKTKIKNKRPSKNRQRLKRGKKISNKKKK